MFKVFVQYLQILVLLVNFSSRILEIQFRVDLFCFIIKVLEISVFLGIFNINYASRYVDGGPGMGKDLLTPSKTNFSLLL